MRLLLVLLLTLMPVATYAAGDKHSKTDKCPVCGMFVSRYPDWLSVIAFKSGERAYFDGPKDMFTYYLDMGRYGKGKKQSDIAAVTVKDYYGLKSLDAKKAYFVAGSDINGPMGRELVPLATATEAADFIRDHKGSPPLRFNDISRAVLERLQ